MAATTIMSGSVITARAAVAGISGASTIWMMTKAISAQEALRPNLRISHSAMRLASRTLTSMELRMKASRFNQITSIPSTSMMALGSDVRVMSSRNISTSEVR
jgi:hypothetical protein